MVANEKWFGGGSAGFYPFEIGQSLKLDGDARLSHSHQTAPTLQTKATVSFWIKLHDNNDRNIVLHTGVGTSNNTHMTLAFGGGTSYDGISVGQYNRNLYVNPSTGGAVQRDISNFYHFQMTFDSTSSTASERVVKLYVNGEQITLGTFTQMGQDDLFPLTAQTNAIYIGGHTPGYNYFTSGNIAELIVIDGQAHDNTYFGETKNGVWIPKEYTGTYGNNGFRLTFEGSGINTTTDGTTAQTNLGDDQSSNGNNFAIYSSSVGTHDFSLDSPTNNFCTLDPNFRAVTANTLSEGNLKCVTSTSGRSFNAGSFLMTPNSGKWYWEFRSDANSGGMGVAKVNGILGANQSVTSTSTSAGSTDYYYGETNWVMYGDGIVHNASYVGGTDVMGSPSYPQIWGIGIDMDASPPTISYYIDGSSVRTVNLDTGYDYIPIVGDGSGGVSRTININFGQNPTFNGTETAGTNTDGNGNGLFHDAVPTNHLALCSSNLPDTTISPAQDTQADDHFSILLYDGDGNSTQDVTGVGFQPDWTWIKERTSTSAPVFLDSSRGYDKFLVPSSTNDEGTGVSNSVLPDGFQTNNSGVTNENNQNYVAWNWLAGGTAPTKTYKVKVVADSTDYGHGTGSNKYQFLKSDGSTGFGTNGVDLDLQEGGTYVFDWSDSCAQSHPLRFSLTNYGTHSNGTSAGSEYTTGVVKDDSAYKTTITIASGVANLYYYCQNHSGMGAEINTNTLHGSTNFDGSITSIVQTNSTSGLSIIKYVGTGSALSYGHGLSERPTFYIVKDRDTDATNWFIQYFDGSSDYYLAFNTVVQTAISTFTPDATKMNYGSSSTLINQSGKNYIVYAFHSVEGFSKISTYEMNANVDGPYVYLGFRPSFLLIKTVVSAGAWTMYDDKRDPFNDGDSNILQPDTVTGGTTEASFGNAAIDLLSNGFKLRHYGDGYSNIASNTALFIAFARTPFKFSNAR